VTRSPGASGIVLAGGQSTRLGRDKASEVLRGRSLLQRAVDAIEGLVDECVVVVAAGQKLPSIETTLPLRVVEDTYARIGPLGGIFTGLEAIEHDGAVVVACDLPVLQPALLAELLRRLHGHDAVVPLNGLPEPLCAAYSKRCLAAIGERIEAAAYKVTGFFDAVDVQYVEQEIWRRFDADGLSFLNVNREADLQRADALLAEREAAGGGA
jgi:molybdopterin-guanine dinucleotide biosynthesis protein A